MKTILRTSHLSGLMILFLLSAVWLAANGQSTTATLSGVVHDPTGAVLPQVKITIKNSARGTTRATVTDNEGRYNLSNVEPGTYELRAERTGFSTDVRSGLVLTVGGAQQADLTLRIGPTTEVVTVTDAAPLIETSKAEVSTVISERAIQSLPNIGRNFV